MTRSDSRAFGEGFPFQHTIIIPAYNEAERIAPTLDHISAYIEEKQWSVEIIVVDDGSTDATADIVSHFATKNPSIRLIQNPTHRGKGHCVRTGVMNADGDVILIMDADLPARMEEMHLLLRVLGEGADIAIGSRWLRPELQQMQQPFLRRCLGRCFNLLIRSLLGIGFRDTQCGFKAFKHQAASLTFRCLTVAGWAFDAELLVIAKGLGLIVKEVPVQTRHDGRSRLKPWTHGSEMLLEVLKISWGRLRGKYSISLGSSVPLRTGGTRRLIPTAAAAGRGLDNIETRYVKTKPQAGPQVSRSLRSLS